MWPLGRSSTVFRMASQGRRWPLPWGPRSTSFVGRPGTLIRMTTGNPIEYGLGGFPVTRSGAALTTRRRVPLTPAPTIRRGCGTTRWPAGRSGGCAITALRAAPLGRNASGRRGVAWTWHYGAGCVGCRRGRRRSVRSRSLAGAERDARWVRCYAAASIVARALPESRGKLQRRFSHHRCRSRTSTAGPPMRRRRRGPSRIPSSRTR